MPCHMAGGGCSAGALTRTGRPAGPVTRPGGKVRNPAGATGICITRSTVIPGWYTRRSSTTSIKTPRRVSGGGQAAFRVAGCACRRGDDRQRRLLPFTRVRRGVGAGVSSTGEPGANRPQTSGNEELFDRTLMTERAYARPY